MSDCENIFIQKIGYSIEMDLSSQVPTSWIGTRNVNTPTVTSQIPHFWRGIWAQCRGILSAQDGIEDGFFLLNIKAFLDGLLLIFHAQEIFKSTTHNPGPHPTSLFMIYLYPPLMVGLSSQEHFFSRWKWRVMSLTALSAGAIVHIALLTAFSVTGRY